MPRSQWTIFAGIVGLPLLTSGLAASEADLGPSLEPVRQEFGLPAVAAAVHKDGKRVATGATGLRALGKVAPVTIDDRFHLGSDTKAMTATLAGMLVDEGKLSWTSTIGDILAPAAKAADLPAFTPSVAAITLEQLLSHTSGIPSDTEALYELYVGQSAYDMTSAARRLQIITAWGSKSEPAFPPGSPFQYANLGYMTAGAMIETAAGEPWESLITRRIFDALELKSAGLGPQVSPGRLDAASGHLISDDGKVTPMPWGAAADIPQVLGPAGTSHMSIRDFATWAAWNAGGANRGPKLVTPETLVMLHRQHVAMPPIENPKPGTPKGGGYGFGWGIMKMDWTPRPILTHNGSNSLNYATILIDPAIDLAIVVTTNYPGDKADQALIKICRSLYERYSATAAPAPP
jgi:CubicO group peptidase (beta-lactamase class C family)